MTKGKEIGSAGDYNWRPIIGKMKDYSDEKLKVDAQWWAQKKTGRKEGTSEKRGPQTLGIGGKSINSNEWSQNTANIEGRGKKRVKPKNHKWGS